MCDIDFEGQAHFRIDGVCVFMCIVKKAVVLFYFEWYRDNGYVNEPMTFSPITLLSEALQHCHKEHH